MERQIFRPETRMKGTVKGVPGAKDAYFDRLLKLIPGESVALFLFLQGVIFSALSDPGREGELRTWLWAMSIVLVIGNIFYLKKISQVIDPVQIIILTLAFIIWIVTIVGESLIGFYEPFMGAVILGIFTFFVPIVYKGQPVS